MFKIILVISAFMQSLICEMSNLLGNERGSAIYTPSTNVVANILNRRTETQILEVMKSLTEFDDLVQSRMEFGDTLEHIQTAISESSAYDVKANQSEKYVDTVLNKIYNKINFSKVYNASTPQAEYRKAIGNPQALADLVSRVVGKQQKTWVYDMYNEFVSLFENDTNLKETYVPDFSTFGSDTQAVRDDKIEKFLQQVFETIEKMRYYSTEYITVDSSLTQAEQDRMIATAPNENVTLYLNSKYFSWAQVDLSKRFRNLVDLDKAVTVKIINFTNSSRVGYLVHNGRYGWYPQLVEADEAKPFGIARIDHALTVEGAFAKIEQFPATVLVPSANYPDPPVA